MIVAVDDTPNVILLCVIVFCSAVTWAGKLIERK